MKEFPNLLAICATCGRFSCLKRSLALFIDQDYIGEHTLLIFNNSEVPYTIELPELLKNKHVILINNHLNSKTGIPYSSLGEIYNDVRNFWPDEVEVVYSHDDDDLYLPNHLSEGVKGLHRCGKLAYKPKYSWFKHSGGVELMENTLEPSIFVNAKFLKEVGYRDGINVSSHLSWVEELLRRDEICSDPEGIPTLLYTWGTDPVYKTSGAGETPTNFENYRRFSTDFGNKVVSPAARLSYKDLLRVPNAIASGYPI
jgi:hypothetical protein